MTRYEDYDDRSLAEIIFDEVPFVKESYQEYKKDQGEYNANEDYRAIFTRESGYDI